MAPWTARRSHRSGSTRTATSFSLSRNRRGCCSQTAGNGHYERQRAFQNEQWDLTGAGTYGRSETEVTVINADGSATTTISRYSLGALANTEVTTESANGLVVTRRRDEDGNGVFDQTRTDTTVVNADGTETRTITTTKTGGMLISTVSTLSADGRTITFAEDNDGIGGFERSTVENTLRLADGSRSRRPRSMMARGQLKSTATTTVSGDGKTVSEQPRRRWKRHRRSSGGEHGPRRWIKFGSDHRLRRRSQKQSDHCLRQRRSFAHRDRVGCGRRRNIRKKEHRGQHCERRWQPEPGDQFLCRRLSPLSANTNTLLQSLERLRERDFAVPAAPPQPAPTAGPTPSRKTLTGTA